MPPPDAQPGRGRKFQPRCLASQFKAGLRRNERTAYPPYSRPESTHITRPTVLRKADPDDCKCVVRPARGEEKVEKLAAYRIRVKIEDKETPSNIVKAEDGIEPSLSLKAIYRRSSKMPPKQLPGTTAALANTPFLQLFTYGESVTRPSRSGA